ncbi:HAMP domain-containing sensor histidine kinase [Nitrospirillum sp. BR 11828]|uniref:sensor histidine kinase n=1 Tax=Nitrospirillum sp. BR 11828 TaxID=3104325 RepID=UPI002ACB043D|nr:HAMP domain-containing sensor histidine kinase [Nitrospirillum sp. BR 11828]MDZ5650347.1 HAMP domain-containing sensor histidine kinase [Nitrospirillum sp. BR 11828]
MTDLLSLILILTILNGVASALIWTAYRHLAGVRTIAFSFMMGGCAAVLGLFYRPGPGFLAGMTGYVPNTLVFGSLGLCLNGVMIFLGERPRKWLLGFCVGFPLLYWPLSLYLWPDSGAPRSAINAFTTLIAFTSVMPALWRARGDCAWLRWTLLPVLVLHVVIQGGWSLHRLDQWLSGTADPTMFYPWTVVETAVAHHLWFVCFLIMLGARLQSNVTQRNQELAHEVDTRRHLEQQLAATLAAERQIHAEHRQLLDVVVHEIRTPLAGIDRAAEMLQVLPGSVPEPARRRLGAIRDGVHRVTGLVERIMASEREGHMAAQPQPIEWMHSVQTVIQGLSHLNAGRVTVVPPASPILFMADPGMLIAVLRNLIENALKYSPEGAPVTVEAGEDTANVVIRVTDRGIGIPEMERQSIGRRFYRASNANNHPGNGLGLFIVRRFLTEMGGTLSHTGGPNGVGTVATVVLPLRPAQWEDPDYGREKHHA